MQPLRALFYLKGTSHRTLDNGDVADIAGFSDSDLEEIGTTTRLQEHPYSEWEMEGFHENRSSKCLLCMAMYQAAKGAVWPTGLLKDLVIDLKASSFFVATVRVRFRVRRIPSFGYALYALNIDI